MLFDWSAACAADDSTLVVPWHDAASGLLFLDLRSDPLALEDLPEAQQHPALGNALRSLNAPRSPVFTAKCDAWAATPEETHNLLLELAPELLEPALLGDPVPDPPPAAFLSYIDLLCRDRAMFASLHQQQHLLGRLERRLTPLDHPHSLVEAVIRPALLDFDTPQEGFSTTLYCKAFGPTPHDAYTAWADTLLSLTTVLRSRDLFPQT